ncbi:GGDEF domain-containing protein [Nitrincola tibetensis]|uniref:diguanylate cyclase n=1 Tax=Nitrincola tibetensis TaxID=2219697 RepID=A0A364NS49_9GAMM|nr:GGDEF domain-containing protein [Nitrincola tibetensis]
MALTLNSRIGSLVSSCCFVFLIGIFCWIPNATSATISLDSDWSYRWGDSPFDEQGSPLWSQEPFDSPEWQAIDFPSNPPERKGQTNVWYKTSLPHGQWTDPVLYIYSVDLIVQVYLDGLKIYEFGEFDQEGRGAFAGWPWHSISLPEGFEGKPIYFRIFSDYSDIGLWGEVKVMEKPDLILFILSSSLKDRLIFAFCVLIGILAFIFSLFQSHNRTYSYLTLFSLASAGMIIGESQATQLIYNAPMFWRYLAAMSYFTLPIAISGLLYYWLANTSPLFRMLRWIRNTHIVFLVLALVLSLTEIVRLSHFYPAFDALFVVTLISMLVLIVPQHTKLDTTQTLIVCAYAVYSAFLLIDMAVAHGFIAWWRFPVSVGALLFSMTLVVISILHFNQTQKALVELTLSLEQKVIERTEKIQRYALREKERARLLALENKKMRALEQLVEQLHKCTELQEALQLLFKRLPALLKPLPATVRFNSVRDRMLPSALTPQSILSFSIKVDDATDKSYVCAVIEIEESPLVHDDTINAISLFISRAADRLGITLSSIKLQEELQQLSYEDALTGLKNRRFFDELLKRESMIALRQGTPLSVLICDIDHFKQFNDRFGHEAGDMALKSLADCLLTHFRETDISCRYGGEEFVVVMPAASREDAVRRAKQLILDVEKTPIEYLGQSIGTITLSIGIATWPETVDSPSQLLKQADTALYQAKQKGRNRVEHEICL